MERKNVIPEFSNQSGDVYVAGNRVRVESRHGTKGTGTVTRILRWDNAPDTICVEMDADTEYAPVAERGWALDEFRIPDTGLFGGEIDGLIPVH